MVKRKILSGKYKRIRKLKRILKHGKSGKASVHFQWGIRWVDVIIFPINILFFLFAKITLIQDCKDPLELMEAELTEEELDVQNEV